MEQIISELKIWLEIYEHNHRIHQEEGKYAQAILELWWVYQINDALKIFGV